jgi:hypothetical protein
MNETKLEINENYEEAELSDVEDDVFVRSGGRNGYRVEYDTAKKPLMTPKRKKMVTYLHQYCRHSLHILTIFLFLIVWFR